MLSTLCQQNRTWSFLSAAGVAKAIMSINNRSEKVTTNATLLALTLMTAAGRMARDEAGAQAGGSAEEDYRVWWC